MQTLTINGIKIGEFRTRAETIVYCFSQDLVYDRFSRKRNQLLPGVNIEGSDERASDVVADDDCDSGSFYSNLTDSDRLHIRSAIEECRRKHRGDGGKALPERGPLDTRSDSPPGSYERLMKRRTRRRWL